MANRGRSNREICYAYLAGDACPKSAVRKVPRRKNGNGGWGGGTNMQADDGTRRLWFNRDEGILWSYEHYALAVRLATGLILVNNAPAPTPCTARQTRALRDAHRETYGGPQLASLSFAALAAAGIGDTDIPKINVTAHNPTYRVPIWIPSKTCTNCSHALKSHAPDGACLFAPAPCSFTPSLTESGRYIPDEILFRYGTDVYFAAAFPGSDHQVLMRLRNTHEEWPRTIVEAWLSIDRPKIPVPALGPWSFIPVTGDQPGGKKTKPEKQIPIDPSAGEKRFVAQRYVKTVDGVYVRDVIRDAVYGTLRFPDPAVWYAAVHVNAEIITPQT